MNKGIQNKSTSKVRFWHLVKFVFLSIVFACGIIGMARTRPPSPIEIKPVYILGFAEHSSDRIRVRWSEDGQTWGDGDFPNHTTSVGVGATSSAAGLLNIMFWADSSNKLQALWGLGPAIWDTRPGGPSLTQQVLSAPSAAYAGNSLYLLAYRTTGDTVAVRVLNSSTRRWLTTSLAPAHPSNSSVRGSPTIIILRGKVLLAWHRSGTCEIALGDVQIVTVGGEKVPVINWTNIYTFSLSESGFGNPSSDPTLTHDGSRFYLGLIRRTTGGPLQADWLFIYSSSDGISWNLQKTKPGVILYADVNIAARSDGSLLVALVAPGVTIPKREVYKLAGGSWTQLDADTVFGWAPGTKPFTLISNKR